MCLHLPCWWRPVCPWRDLDNIGGCGHHWSDPIENIQKPITITNSFPFVFCFSLCVSLYQNRLKYDRSVGVTRQINDGWGHHQLISAEGLQNEERLSHLVVVLFAHRTSGKVGQRRTFRGDVADLRVFLAKEIQRRPRFNDQSRAAKSVQFIQH